MPIKRDNDELDPNVPRTIIQFDQGGKRRPNELKAINLPMEGAACGNVMSVPWNQGEGAVLVRRRLRQKLEEHIQRLQDRIDACKQIIERLH